MTLKEYIEKTRAEYSLEEDTESIADRIKTVARGKSTAGCAILSDEEVLEIIMDPELGKKAKPPVKEEKPEDKKAEKKEPEKPKETKEQEKPKEKPGTVKYGDGDMESLF